MKRARYSDKRIRKFLTQWLLSFGAGVVANEGVYSVRNFYIKDPMSVSDRELNDFILWLPDGAKQITQAGIDFIKGPDKSGDAEGEGDI